MLMRTTPKIERFRNVFCFFTLVQADISHDMKFLPTREGDSSVTGQAWYCRLNDWCPPVLPPSAQPGLTIGNFFMLTDLANTGFFVISLLHCQLWKLHFPYPVRAAKLVRRAKAATLALPGVTLELYSGSCIR